MHCERYGPTLNNKKTKYVIVSKRVIENVKERIGAKSIERARKFQYLGQLLTEDSNHPVEIKDRIEQARTTFIRMKCSRCTH